MRALRTKSVSTKLTEDEYAALEALAGGRSLSEFARDILLNHKAAVQQPIEEELVLAEVLALRTILLNWHFAIANGDTPSADEMRQLIEQADQDKYQRAKDRLVEARRREP
jgi:mobilization protein NikA